MKHQILLAAIILSGAVKYGPTTGDGSISQLTSTTTKGRKHSKKNPLTTTTSTVTEETEAIGAVPGIKLQSIPEQSGGISIGAGYYFDNTVEVNLGIRL